MKRNLVLFTTLFSIFLTLACTKKPNTESATTATTATVPDEIIIGQYGSLTGSEATFGINTDRGIRLVIDEVNAKGGIKGKKIKLVTYDNQSKAEEAASVVKRLITQDHVLALLGEVASTRSLAAAPIAQQFKIPMISPSSTNPKVTQVGDYIFRVCFIDPFQGTVMAKFANTELKLKKIAVLRDIKSDYSLGLAEYFIKTFKEAGGEVVDEQSYQSGDTDFKAQLTQIRTKKPDGIFIPGYYTEVGLIARQARQLGLNVPLLGGDGWESPKLHEIGKEAVQGSFFSTHFTAENKDPVVESFIARYKAKFNEVPDGLAAAAYDAAMVLVQAIERAPELTSTAIREEIAKTKNYSGATGIISIDGERNATKPAVVVKVEKDGIHYVTTVNP